MQPVQQQQAAPANETKQAMHPQMFTAVLQLPEQPQAQVPLAVNWQHTMAAAGPYAGMLMATRCFEGSSSCSSWARIIWQAYLGCCLPLSGRL